MVRYAHFLSPALLGRRVMVRHATGGGLTDAVGDLVAWDGGVLTVRTRGGDVRIDAAAVVAGKPVGEARLRAAADAGVGQLERAVAAAAPGERAWLGGWLLLAGAAWSVSVLGEPGRPVDAALDEAAGWCAARGAPLAVRLPGAGTAGFDPLLGSPLDAALDARGWPAGQAGDVLVADLADPTDPAEPAPGPAAGLAVAPGGRSAVATATPPAGPAATARGDVEGRWLGVHALGPAAAPVPALAAALAALGGWAHAAGARHAWVDASPGGPPAAACTAAGFARHHGYRVRTRP